jgi:hypothetical protein
MTIPPQRLDRPLERAWRRHAPSRIASAAMSLTSRSRVSLALLLIIMLGSTTAFAAEEPSGCDKFKWPI